ncbi:MAG: zf-HC2 domain-containing protein [Oscillospiraceae bacterium]|nr:zf-HC2 domain-containing protein [Oscillospiraceae bacterium]
MSDCERWQELMSQMLDDEISQEDAAALRVHMRTCRDCQAMWNMQFSISHAIRQDVVPPPDSLGQGVMARIQGESRRERESARRRGSRAVLPRWGRAAAAACLVIVIGAVAFAAWDGRGVRGSGSSLSIRAADTAEAETVEAAEADMAISGDTMEEDFEEETVETAEEETSEEETAQATERETAASITETAAADGGGLAVYDMDGGYLGSISAEDEAAFAALLDAVSYSEADGSPEDICSVEYQGVVYIFSTTDSGLLFWRDAAEGGAFCSSSGAEALWALIAQG